MDSWDDYFMQFAELAASRAHCLRRQVGAVLVRDRMILATGYNGPPRGVPHCDKVGCIRIQKNVPSGSHHELCRGLHAEQNVIIQCAYQGVRTEGATIYTDTYPCSICMKMIINAGITRVVYFKEYSDTLTSSLVDATNIKFEQLRGE